MGDYRHDIAHLARVEVLTPDPAGTEWFFTQLLGMYVTNRVGQSAYLRGYEDPYQWSLKITESPEAGLRHAALRTSSPEALERRVKSLRDANIEGSWGENEFGYGKTYSFQTPDGHNLDLVWEVEKFKAPENLRSKILSRPSRKPLQGLPVKRLDHMNLLCHEVEPTRELLENHLGYRTTETVIDQGVQIGAWLTTNMLAHEIATMRDAMGGHGRLHHVAFYYGVQQDLINAAEMFRDYDVKIECGPDVHGITQGAFLYVIEPGGNRIELFGNAGYLHLDPDPETSVWSMQQLADAGLAIGGAELPGEYFTYGTPALLSAEVFADLQDLQASPV